ncbi:MAG: 16S rRNA (cytosine(1402)-N(4))-methyltransferase RsmH [Candidatus Krumholzibacteria bacterium]|nr:16S rRNA (cytosine(1402)-N(4))-methyltransferase RsmH [Candidatus Krumholzibacteria bacterium]
MIVEHLPVMVEEVTGYLITDPEGIYVDATLGLGGHTESFLKAAGPKARVIGIDLDENAIRMARERLAEYGERVTYVCGNFRDIDTHLGGGKYNGILVDLGMSSFQISDRERGFSYMEDGPLGMSMGTEGRSVRSLLADGEEKEIADIIWRFGEEKKSRRIAKWIVKTRENEEIVSTSQLRLIVEKALPSRGLIGSLSRVFQAFRIWANDELENLRAFLPQAAALLIPGGRLAVLSYHSLEDRIVKNYFRQEEKGCICPPDFPQCNCGRVPTLKLLMRRAGKPSLEEIESNPRSRSARLRVAERLAV